VRDQSNRPKQVRDQSNRPKQVKTRVTRNKSKEIEDAIAESGLSKEMCDDALKYEKALKKSLQFVTCGVCAWEGPPTKFLHRKDSHKRKSFGTMSVEDIIKGSSLSELKRNIESYFEELCCEFYRDENRRGYLNEWRSTFEDNGTIRGAMYFCKSCVKTCSIRVDMSTDDLYDEDMNADDEDECDDVDIERSSEELLGTNRSKSSKCLIWHGRSYSSVPLNVYMLLFRGECPKVLKDLNTVELSMVSPINIISRICITGKHDTMKAKIVSVVNELAEIAKQLPNMPSPESFASVRCEGSTNKSKLYYYRPYYVKKAIQWLCERNIVFHKYNFNQKLCESWSEDVNFQVPLHSHIMSESDGDALEEAFEEGVSTNTGN
jgi:hypothetical protein